MNPPAFIPVSLRPWYVAARPRSLTATYAPLLVGAAITIVDHDFFLIRFVLALIGALFLQIAANLINEYVDFVRGTDTAKTDGMGMVLSKGGLTPNQVLIAAVVTVVAGALIGLYLMFTSGLLLLWIGLGGVLVVITYTAGPIPLAYIGLGELAVFLFMGPLMVLGTYYAVSGGQFSWAAVAAGIPLGFTVANILHANNIRDLEADKLANKQTLAVRFGMKTAKQEYAVLNYGAYVVTVLLIIARLLPWTCLVVFITLPNAISLVRTVSQTEEPAVLHRAQGMTAQLHLRLGLALASGWLLYAVILQISNGISTLTK